ARSFQDPRWRASALGEGVSQRFACAARRPFKITMTSATSCTNTTAARPSTPLIASGINTMMMARDSTMFWLMILLPRRACCSACGISRRSWPVKATSADSIAASEPVATIAIPTVAPARAGADHRRRRLGGEFGDDACLVLRAQLGAHVVDSGDFSQRPGGASVVAGEHAYFHIVSVQGLHGFGHLGPQLVADPDRPGKGVI